MASAFSSSIQSKILSLLLSRLPLHPLDIPQQSSLSITGNSGPSLHLTNITLDIDKLETQYLPPSAPINIRHAFVEDLKIIIGTSGIQVLLSGITCVISPKVTGVNAQSLDPSNSTILGAFNDPLEGLEGMVESVVGFVDVVSGARSFNTDGKATNMEWGDEITDDDDDDDKNNSSSNEPEKSLKDILENDLEISEELKKKLPENTKTSSNTIISYAVDYIMGKLSVSLENLSIKVVTDPIVLNVKINKIHADGNTTERRCQIDGISTTVLKPKKQSAENTTSDLPQKVEGEANCETDDNEFMDKGHEDNRKKDDNNIDDDDDDDYDDQLMSASFIAESKDEIQNSILESAMYSRSGKSIYMSASQGEFYDMKLKLTEESLERESKQDNSLDENKEDEFLIIIDSINVCFKNRKNLIIEFGKLCLTLVPMPELLSAFITLLIQINKQKYFTKLKITEKKQPSVSSLTLQHFSISELNISIDSDLLKDGSFENNNSTRLHCAKFLLQQRNPTLFQGTLACFEILTGDSQKCFFFNDPNDENPDIRIELQNDGKSHVTTIIIGKPLYFDIKYDLLLLILKFYNSLSSTWEKLDELKLLQLKKVKAWKSSNNSLRKPYETNNKGFKSEIAFKLQHIRGCIQVSADENDSLQIMIAPMSYDTFSKNLTVEFLKLNFGTAFGNAIIDVHKIRYNFHGDTFAKFRIFDVNSQKEVVCTTKKTVIIEDIEIESSLDTLTRIHDVINDIIPMLKGPVQKGKSVQFDNSFDQNMVGSSFLFKPKVMNYYILVKHLNYSILNLNKRFGDIVGEIDTIGVTSSFKNLIQVSIIEILMKRSKKEAEEVILKKANKWSTYPMIFVKFQKSIHLFLNNWCMTYSGKWLEMFEKENIIDKYDTKSNSNLNDLIHAGLRTKTKKKPVSQIFVSLTDICLGLRPVNLDSECLLLISKANSDLVIYNDKTIVSQLTSNLISVFLIDDITNLNQRLKRKHKILSDRTILSILKNEGYVQIGSLNTVLTKIKVNTVKSLSHAMADDETHCMKCLVDTQLNVEKINLDLCCDSAQCFLQLLKDLKKPVYFSYDDKYKDSTKEFNVFEDIDSSFFSQFKRSLNNDGGACDDSVNGSTGLFKTDKKNESLSIIEDFYDNLNEYSDNLNPSTQSSFSERIGNNDVSFNSKHFENRHSYNNKFYDNIFPLYLHISISDISLSLYDGYDWKETRVQIRNALERVSKRAKAVADKYADQLGSRAGNVSTSDTGTNIDNTVKNNYNEIVEETVYQSILLEIGPADDPTDIYHQINESLGGYNSMDGVKDTHRNKHPHTIDLGKNKIKPLGLKRSLKNKIMIKLDDIDIDFKLMSNNEPHLKTKPRVFSFDEKSDDYEHVNEVDISVNNFIITDNVPTSSWNMFAGYMRESGEREIGKSMFKLTIDLVRPIPRLAAIEMIMHVSILPLRLYVDQDTLDFLTRFGEFKDQRFIPNSTENEEMFLEKIVVDTVKLKLDYKPKTIDYAGLRSGHTSEFMNVFILDGSEIILNKVVLYGVAGFSKLHGLLNGYWSPDVKKNQLGGVLSGLAPVRSIINIGSGVNNLVTVPMKEYRKDGRIMRSLQVGAMAFTKATGGELLKLGAKLAAGTQTILENTEEALGGTGSTTRVVDTSIGSQRWENRERKSNNRRRSSAASFGDEGEEDYHRYFFRNNNNGVKRSDNFNVMNDIDIGDSDEQVISEAEVDSDYDKNPFSFVSSGGIDRTHDSRNRNKSESYVVSLYSNQPSSFNEGLKIAYSSIQKNFTTAKNAVYEAGIRASESESASGAAYELAKATPIVLLRPAIATTEAISKGLLGGVNDINPDEKVKADEKYKRVQSDSHW